jgi:hypothetical protein
MSKLIAMRHASYHANRPSCQRLRSTGAGLDPKACKALLDYLKSPQAEAIYKAHGIAPVK